MTIAVFRLCLQGESRCARGELKFPFYKKGWPKAGVVILNSEFKSLQPATCNLIPIFCVSSFSPTPSVPTPSGCRPARRRHLRCDVSQPGIRGTGTLRGTLWVPKEEEDPRAARRNRNRKAEAEADAAPKGQRLVAIDIEGMAYKDEVGTRDAITVYRDKLRESPPFPDKTEITWQPARDDAGTLEFRIRAMLEEPQEL